MKKILFTIAFISYILASKTSAIEIHHGNSHYSAPDTLQYLKDSIEARKNAYIGKPLNILLKDLKLEVKEYGDSFIDPRYRTNDSVRTPGIDLYFNTRMFEINTMLSKGEKGNLHMPYILIIFSKPVALARNLWKYGSPYYTVSWTPMIANFFGSQIISEIKVIEY